MQRVVPFSDLGSADLIVDAVYEGGSAKNTGADPLSKLLPGVGNQGGFRIAGRGAARKLVVLYTSGEDKDWPDRLEPSTGRFTYFGDNKTPGHELHETTKGGNGLLRDAFAALHQSPPSRAGIPPFLVFTKHPHPTRTRSIRFLGLAVPGAPGLPGTEDLVAIWKISAGQRFQNYRATFTILDVPTVSRAWITALTSGHDPRSGAPTPWLDWVDEGRFRPLTAEPTTVIRTVEEQTPDSHQAKLLDRVWRHFAGTPIAFEAFAAYIFGMLDQRVIVDGITRGVVDGGRDAFGRYLLGLDADPVYAEFSLEAKCYRPPLDGGSPNTVGVKEVSRLISRIRHRQFGVLVTTSVVARQAYEEVREDRHPIIFICGRDIAEILLRNGYSTAERVDALLTSEFPV
jgi:hypothetical protein